MSLPGVYKIFNDRWCKQTVWIYSDTHFSDEDLEEGICGRPSDAEHVAMINSCVGRKDSLIHLGDVGNLDVMRQVRGYKILIMGNHDTGASRYQREIKYKKFDIDTHTKDDAIAEMKNLYPNCKYTLTECYDVLHAPFHYWEVKADNCLFDEVYEGPLMIGEKLILSHEPIPNLTWAMNLHGHVHVKKPNDKYHFNVCSDAIGYKPINLNQLLKNGVSAKIPSIHRIIIDKATKKARKKK